MGVWREQGSKLTIEDLHAVDVAETLSSSVPNSMMGFHQQAAPVVVEMPVDTGMMDPKSSPRSLPLSELSFDDIPGLYDKCGLAPYQIMVIGACYNDGGHAALWLESIEKSIGLEDVGAVIVDDHSDDETLEHITGVASWGEKDSDDPVATVGLEIMSLRKNVGPGFARQAAVECLHPDTEYVIFLDMDDRMTDGMQMVLETIRMHDDCAVAWGKITGTKQYQRMMTAIEDGGTPWDVVKGGEYNPISLCTAVVRRSALDATRGFGIAYWIAQDYRVWLDFASAGMTGLFVDVESALYGEDKQRLRIRNSMNKERERRHVRREYLLEKSFKSGTGRSILFMMSWFGIGGSQAVCLDMARWLKERGWNVACLLLQTNEQSEDAKFFEAAFDKIGDMIYGTNIGNDEFEKLSRLYDVRFAFGASRLPKGQLVYAKMGGMTQFNREQVPENVVGIYPCNYIKTALETHRGRSDDNGVVIINGVDVPKFLCVGSRDNIRKQLGIKERALVYLWVGRMSKGKGLPLFMKAAAQLVKGHPEEDVHFVIVGPVRDRTEHQFTSREMDANGISDCVHYLGAVRPDKMKHVYNAADVFCMASESEGLSVAMLEALASSLPIISTAHGSDEEVLSPSNSVMVRQGDVAGYANAMALMIDEPSRINRAKSSRKLAPFYDRNYMMLQHEKLFVEGLGTEKSGPIRLLVNIPNLRWGGGMINALTMVKNLPPDYEIMFTYLTESEGAVAEMEKYGSTYKLTEGVSKDDKSRQANSLRKAMQEFKPDVVQGNTLLACRVSAELGIPVVTKAGSLSGTAPNGAAYADVTFKVAETIPGKGEVNLFGVEPVEWAKKRTIRMVVWVGRMELDRDPALFFDAMKKLAETRSNFTIRIIGGCTSGLVDVDAEIAKRGLSSITENLGHLPQDEARRMMAEGDVICSPKPEGSGTAVAEAMTAGLIPVVPDTVYGPELAKDGELGVMVAANAEAIAAGVDFALKDRSLRRKRNAIRSYAVSKWNPQRMAMRYDEVYRRLTGRAPYAELGETHNDGG